MTAVADRKLATPRPKAYIQAQHTGQARDRSVAAPVDRKDKPEA
jgi:hypothetical protein